LVYTSEGGYGTPVTSNGFNILELLNRPEETMAGHVLSGWNTLMAQLVKIAAWRGAS
jgi:hypothetical protein